MSLPCEGLYATQELGPAERADKEEGWCMGIRFLLAGLDHGVGHARSLCVMPSYATL
jgi:hypothetical protein